MMQISREISRQVGLIINRRGLVEYVVIGEKGRIEIPPLVTERVGRERFRGVRFVHTHIEGELLSKEDLTDLAILQLDLVAAITERRGESIEMIHIGHLIPEDKKGKAWEFIGPVVIQDLEIDFIGLVTELENEFAKAKGSLYTLAEGREQAVLVCVVLPGRHKDVEDSIAEARDLCYSAGIAVLDTAIQRTKELHPKYLIGKGKLEETIMKCRQQEADLLVFDEGLTPGQIKNISALTELKVIDRNQLILDIFAQRANTNESKIQVELAQLNYILPRLAEKNAALSRLTGGIGARGPGETKLEVNKSRIRARLSFLQKKLEEIRKIRDKKRERRRDSLIPIVSIVGYTNSGKSTLLNLLTKSNVEAEDRSFSTLNPTTRLIKYPERKNIIVTDTVGFIKDLPEVLLRAFIATLEELEDADLLLHLVDISSPDFEEKIHVVEKLITKLHLNEKKVFVVFNKIDMIDREFLDRIEDRYHAVSISCRKKEGIERLLQTIEIELHEGHPTVGFLPET
ncbi:MAG: GTPase HflX [Proteobacteria bacterium]|nr:GTPase HflX [Pseudomonadota bacterium]